MSLAEEGINLFLASAQADARPWLRGMCQHPPFAGLRAKEGWSELVPFKRLRVKLKRGVTRTNKAAVVPAAGRAPAAWGLSGHRPLGA